MTLLTLKFAENIAHSADQALSSDDAGIWYRALLDISELANSVFATHSHETTVSELLGIIEEERSHLNPKPSEPSENIQER